MGNILPSEIIEEILKRVDVSSLVNLLSVSKLISQILSSIRMSYAAHISNGHVESLAIVDLIKNLPRDVNLDQALSKYLYLKPTRQVLISEDFPIWILMISSLEKLEDYKNPKSDQVTILILSLRKKDEGSISQYKTFFSSRRFPILKKVIINNQSFAGNYEFFGFDGLNLDHVRMNNCSLNGATFSPSCKIKQLDMHLTTFYGHNSVSCNTSIERCRITNYKACQTPPSQMYGSPPGIFLDEPNLKFLKVWNASGYNKLSGILFQVGISRDSRLEILKWNARNTYLQMESRQCLSKLETYCTTNLSDIRIEYVEGRTLMSSTDLNYLFPPSTNIDIQEEIDDTDRTRV